MSIETVGTVEAGEILKVHPKTVEDFIKCGKLSAAKIGRSWVMMRQDVVELAQRIILEQTGARLAAKDRLTKGPRPSRSRAGSRSASSSGATCGR